jgi:hypothetical protein
MSDAERAKKMAKAAGPCTPQELAQAALLLIQLAAMTKNPEGYFQWLDKKQGSQP